VKKIEFTDAILNKAKQDTYGGAMLSESQFISYRNGFRDALAYANTILETPPEHKRPFLSDEDIRTEAEYNGIYRTDGYDSFQDGAHWTRDRYEEMLSASTAETIEQWKPQPGDKCAFWDDGYTHAMISTFDSMGDKGRFRIRNECTYLAYQHCALIESLDEIGKPPSYFQNRGRCTVSK